MNDEKMSPVYVGLWIVAVGILLGALVAGVGPLRWATAALLLFLLPELIGLRRDDDSLPPLTHVVRLWVPRWLIQALSLAAAVWMAVAWWPKAEHPLIMVVCVAGIYGWLQDHWDTVYDEWGKVMVEDEVRLWKRS